MKNYLLFIFVICAIVGCKNDELDVHQPDNGMTIEQKVFDVDPSGDIISIKVNTLTTKPLCEVSDDAKDWIELYSWGGAKQGDILSYTFNYKILANDGYEDNRNGSIRLSCGSESGVVSIRQTGGGPFAFIENRKMVINADGGILEIEPKSKFKTENMKDISATWLTLDKMASSTEDGAAKKILFNVSPNDTGADRSTEISYEDKDTGRSDKFTILQGRRIINSDKNFTLSEEKHSFTQSLNTSLDLEVKSSADWVSADSKGNIEIKALPEGLNERQAILTFTNKDNNISESVNICQVRSLRILNIDEEVKELALIPNYEFKLTAGTSALTKDETLVWSSSNEDIVKVSSEGMLIPVGLGEATISLSAGKYGKTCKVVVREMNKSLRFEYKGESEYKEHFPSPYHKYDGNITFTNESSYPVIVKTVSGKPYNEEINQSETFTYPFKVDNSSNGATGYVVKWVLKIGNKDAVVSITFDAGSIKY